MASFNRVVLVGNMTRDPELRTIQNGSTVAEFGLAVNDRRKDSNGNWIEEANFFDVSVWNRSAEIVREYTRKGSPILVEGRLKQDTWEKDGQKFSKVRVVADRVVLLGSRDSGTAPSGGGYAQRQQPSRGGYSQGGGYPQQSGSQGGDYYGKDSGGYSDPGDDIPF